MVAVWGLLYSGYRVVVVLSWLLYGGCCVVVVVW